MIQRSRNPPSLQKNTATTRRRKRYQYDQTQDVINSPITSTMQRQENIAFFGDGLTDLTCNYLVPSAGNGHAARVHVFSYSILCSETGAMSELSPLRDMETEDSRRSGSHSKSMCNRATHTFTLEPQQRINGEIRKLLETGFNEVFRHNTFQTDSFLSVFNDIQSENTNNFLKMSNQCSRGSRTKEEFRC